MSPKLSAGVKRGLRQIEMEMSCYADVKDGEGVAGRKEAADIRAALKWMQALLWLVRA